MPHTYPLMLDVTDRLVVIVGGGAVAARKARALIECGATRVRCVSLTFDESLPQSVERVQARYEAAHLDGARLVFAATDDPRVNDSVVRDARERGVLVSRADDADDDTNRPDFITPARFSKAGGAVTVAVSAGSPALAALVRDELLRRWDARWSQMAETMKELRPLIIARVGDAARRRTILRALATADALEAVSRGAPAFHAWLAGRFPELEHA